jgi:2,4-dienoyl-CoA reductase-like NADH-dependent reductase (Old Yellow Enzyme family)
MNAFSKGSIAGVSLKNRIIRSATHEGLADATGMPLPEVGDLYARIARGGAGAIISGYMSVHHRGKITNNVMMMDRDELIIPYKKITAAVKKEGAPIFAQLAHAGGLADPKSYEGKAVAPSRVRYMFYNRVAEELSEKEIEEIITIFVNAVVRAKKAGFSGVQIHAAHGYLLNEFLSPAYNRRRDRWGGSLENRFRIIGEIIDRARQKVGAYPIITKLSAYDNEKKGLRLEETIEFANLFEKAGFDAIELSCGGAYDSFTMARIEKLPVQAMLSLMSMMKEMPGVMRALFPALAPLMFKARRPLLNYNVDAAEQVRKKVNIPIIVVGGIRDIDSMNGIIEGGKADFVSLSRPFIIEPDIVNRLKSGKQRESRCINCGYCLLGVLDNPLRCYHGRLSAPMAM